MPLVNPRGKVAVITGGASGIGLALAERCLDEGMAVVIGDSEPGPLAEAATRLGVLGVVTDVRRFDSVQGLADAAVGKHGAVHLLANNAGVSVMAGSAVLRLGDWRWVFDVNLFGAVHGVKAFLPLLDANREGGHILNTVSISGLFTTRGQAAYAASKAALLSFSETLAAELQAEGGRVGVTALCPGPVHTNIRTSARNRAADYGDTGRQEGRPDIHEQAFRAALPPDVMAGARAVADAGFDAALRGEFWAITHPDLMQPLVARQQQIMAAARPASDRAFGVEP
jgi:NAD(P)-dependent dehydrogenase (short-subunit alcohol dehydrogenase family)